MFTQTITCGRCSGTGNVGIYWVEGGVCFKCRGRGSLTKTTKTDPVILKARREKAAAKRADAIAAKVAASMAAHEEKEAKRKAAYQAAIDASKASERPVPVTNDRILITGEVVLTKWKYTEFGEVLKMIVKSDDGFKVWGSVPRTIEGDEETLKGKRVKFMARVQVSDKDECFGFYSRPTKAELLAA